MLVTDEKCEILLPDPSQWSAESDPAEIPLSPMDSVMPPCYITAVYVFKNASAEAKFMPFDLLASGLKLALAEFPDLCYRLKRNARGDCLLASRDAPGCRLVTAKADFSVPDLEAVNFDPVQMPAELLDGSPADCGEFGAKVKLTRLSDNSVAIGVLLHHNVTDGDGAFGFVNRWAAICKDLRAGSSLTSRQPFARDRSVLFADGKPPSVEHQEYFYQAPEPAPSQSEEAAAAPKLPIAETPQFTARLFHFSADRLAKLKAGVNGGSGGSGGGDQVVQCTTNDCLVALLWRCITKAKALPAEAATKFALACNARQRLGLPAGYAGNANFYIAEQLTAGEVAGAGMSLPDLARRVRAAVARGSSPDYLRSILRWLSSQPDRSLIRPGFRIFATDLAFTSWVHFPIYAADFGWGRPLRFVVPSKGFDGLVVLLPRWDGDGYEVFTGAEVRVMDKVAGMPEFLAPF